MAVLAFFQIVGKVLLQSSSSAWSFSMAMTTLSANLGLTSGRMGILPTTELALEDAKVGFWPQFFVIVRLW